MKQIALGLAVIFSLSACASFAPNPQSEFFESLSVHCGKAYSGKLVSDNPQDKDMAKENLVMHVANCSANEIRIPFHVGENRSRTWIITKTQNGLRLKHQHNHEDGKPDNSTMYGGDTINNGTKSRQEFPADAYSKDLFIQANIPNSANNVWAVEIKSNEIFAYELKRQNRFFRVEFDLNKEIPAPPKAW